MTFLVVSCQKGDDESRPYEFGFTIDGQQHRHEKKDVNGIIQGEFGFITADGIYHVTVYATDENGNFRILSMKNIRISAPLDGSPLPPGAKISAQPGQGSQNPGLPRPGLPNPRPPNPSPSRPNPPPRIQSTTSRVPFTTQPTIKPACGGCGYVTTPKPVPGQKFPFQTPAFQTPSRNQAGSYPGQGPTGQANPGSTYPQPGTSYPRPETTYPKPGTSYPSPGSTYPNQGSSYPKPGSNYPNRGGANPGSNEIVGHRPSRRPLAQVSVSNGAIHVPGNPDIPIRDKFAGMVDGLPDGITEKDITDLLYKFNYTVGFHGHYEKGLKNGAKIGGYFVTGRDGISRVVTYIADENGFRPKVKFIRLDLNSDEVPKEGTEKKFGLKSFEFIWYPVSIAPPIDSSTSDWNNPSSKQYHIQTDEGPERYFRYQTISGQYRKEKRLDDGTVVGTYAWIDDNGVLRQRDYIADNAGYRILKTKNLYVGRNTPINVAIKSAKKVPASAGTLVKTDSAAKPTPSPVSTVTPYVEIRQNSIPSSTPKPYQYSTTPAPESSTFASKSTGLPNLYLPASTVALERPRSTPAPFGTDPWYYSGNPQYEARKDSVPYTFQNGPTYPIDNRGQTYTGNQIGNGYDPQYDYYDGVSVTNDGFRYYIPRAYHEEQNLANDKKSGSFGYIDPFGIRRVIYYNAGPGTGFQHRKNNRYVGFDATPYDPRPY